MRQQSGGQPAAAKELLALLVRGLAGWVVAKTYIARCGGRRKRLRRLHRRPWRLSVLYKTRHRRQHWRSRNKGKHPSPSP